MVIPGPFFLFFSKEVCVDPTDEARNRGLIKGLKMEINFLGIPQL